MAGPISRLLARSRPAALGLRRRILLIMTLGSIALSVFLATTTFGLTRSDLVTERDESAVETSRRNALRVERDLRPTFPTVPTAASNSLDNIGVQRYMLFYRDTFWFATPPYNSDNVPPELINTVVEDGQSARQIVRIDGELNIVVGWAVVGTWS